MPLSKEVVNYRTLEQHVEKLYLAVQSEKWADVENLWFDRYAVHKSMPKASSSDKLHIQAIITRMDEIYRLLGERRKDIALLLRLPI